MVRLKEHVAVLLTEIAIKSRSVGGILSSCWGLYQTRFLTSAQQDLLNKKCLNAAKHAASVILQFQKLDKMKVTFSIRSLTK